ncbi:MAG: hypothetical protein GY751_08785 [Bacteroidetes bacterium]|nr:hypothetical protein [Bacteroidota bacterium]
MKKPHDDVYAKALKFLSEEDKKAKIPENIKTDDSDALKNPLDILVPGSFFKMDKETGRLSVRDFVKEFKEKGVTLNKVYFRIDPSTKIEVKDKTYQFGDQKPISLQHVKFYVKAIVDTVPEKSEYFPDDEFIKSKKWVWSPVERKSKEIVYSKVRKSLMKLVTLENGKAKLLKKGENAHLTEIMATIHDMNNVTVTKDGISGTITITPTQLFDPKANTIMSGNRVYYFKVGKRVSLKFSKER